MTLAPGQLVHGRYEVLGPLGAGGTATVFRVHDLLFGADVALKLVALDDPGMADSFLREFAVLSGLYHPHLVRVHDFGRLAPGGTPAAYYTCAVVDGVGMDEFADGRSWADVGRALADGLRAVSFLHRAGLRHGDLKPANLLVDRSGRCTLIDLGCVVAPPAGTVSGTRAYMAPEVLAGAPPDRKADLYAVGVTLRELAAIASDVPASVADLASRLTRTDPSERPPDVEEVLAALGEGVGEEGPFAMPHALLEREEVIRAAAKMLDDLLAATPGPRRLFLHGPEGIGRTRVLRECKWIAQARCRVVEGDARRPDAVSDLLRRAAAKPALGDDLLRAVDAWRDLARAPDPTVLVLDDAHLLVEPERRILEAGVRLATPEDSFALFWTGVARIDPLPEATVALELRPLGEDSIRVLADRRIPEARMADLLRVTGGVPGEVRTLLSLARSGAEDLLALATADGLSDRRMSDLDRLDPSERRAVGLCAALDGRLEAQALVALDVSVSSLAKLHAEGWLVPDGGAFRLARLADAERIAGALGADTMAGLHAEIAGWLDAHPERAAERVRHLALGGRADEAEALFASHGDDRAARAHAWRRAADALASVRPTTPVLVATAKVHEAAGDPRRALALVAPLLEGELLFPDAAAVLAAVGSCHLLLGDAKRSIEHLDRALDLAADAESRARVADLLCRARIQEGSYARAAELAERALAWTSGGETEVALHEDLGVAAGYLGRSADADVHLAAAERLAAGQGLPRARVRALSYRAIHEFRLGDTRAAAERYGQALEIAERHGLVDQVASAALNLGTAQHGRADWGAALASYERGLAMAVAVGKLRTEVALRLDLAQLWCDLGCYDRAERFAEEARERAERGHLSFFVAATDLVAGEVLLRRGRHDDARERLRGARELLRAHATPREVADAEIHLAELGLATGDPAEAAARLSAADDAAGEGGAEDLRTRVLLLRGRLELERGRAAVALPLLEEAAPRAAEHDEHDLEAEIESWLFVACERQGAFHAAERHRERALEIWDRCAATLAPHLRDAVWSHPRRAHLPRTMQAPTAPVPTEPSSPRERKLERLLAINARLNSSLDVRDVLAYTMDAAVELTRAERGFLLTARKGATAESAEGGAGGAGGARLRVAVARNVDREAIGRPAMKFSRTIAERVFDTGEPVLTSEAQADDRFSTTLSVQAMGLVSVLCVPIRGRSGVIGALYVDNRFLRGRFDAEDLDILLGLADQVGIALTNAELLAELDARTRQLERERKRIAASLEDRSREVDRLSEEVRLAQRALQDPREYGGLVGRSAAMQAIFATLERAADSSITVLVEGESGTGKELVARALHSKGSRRDGPFVGVNCAALPEPLLESELFGHVRGAFTGADRDRVGLFVHASGGTLFLDEVGEMPPSMQVKLLRALEEGEIRPVGSSETRAVSPRVVCATNRKLVEEVEARRFREDLYYRIAVVHVVVPPLRERVEDIPDLAMHLVRRLAEEAGRPVPRLSVEAIRRLLAYDWPGNVRQLENVLSQALVFSTGDSIGAEEVLLPALSRKPRPGAHRDFLAREAAEIATALEATRWNVAEVSRKLGIPRTSLYRKLRRYGLVRGQRV